MLPGTRQLVYRMRYVYASEINFDRKMLIIIYVCESTLKILPNYQQIDQYTNKSLSELVRNGVKWTK